MDKTDIKYICNLLRQGTMTWKGRTECLNKNRRKKYVGKLKDGRNKYIWEHPCEGCGKWFDQKDNALEVDHIQEVGPFLGDFDSFIRKLYCASDNLQALCVECHKRKTSAFNASLRYERKEKRRNRLEVL